MEDKLKQSEQARGQLAKELVRTKVSLECADNTIKKQQENIKELKAENARLKEEIKQLEVFIKSDGEIDHINHEYTYKLRTCLQQIKAIAKKECKDCLNKRTDSCWICPYYPILEIITKAESEEE